jgi:cytochrome c
MSRRNSAIAAALLCAVIAMPALAAKPWSEIGRAATPAEVKAWDIDVRPDFLGLPAGSGSVDRGQEIWDAKCASCHGTFGESNEVFAPIAGGTNAEDIKTGRAHALTKGEARTTLMKLSTVSTLWDYINRAMPWNAPKSLSADDVYAVTAYILNLGEIVPADFVLSDKNIREVQGRLPNRNGMTTKHGLWDVHGKPDVKNVACMSSCVAEVKVVSELPPHARDAHGNLAAQHRIIGAVRGIDSAHPASDSREQTVKLARAAALASLDAGAAAQIPDAVAIADRAGCMACHALDRKLVGPSFKDVSGRYAAKTDAVAYLSTKIKSGGSGVWGSVPMPPQPGLSDGDAETIAKWLFESGKGN